MNFGLLGDANEIKDLCPTCGGNASALNRGTEK